jgi:iron(II)-dependent oxidoreductase
MTKELRDSFVNKFAAARQRTLAIFDAADEAVLQKSPGGGFRPILWHLAHLGAFEEYWILHRVGGRKPINERFQIIFDPIKTPRESSQNLPSKQAMLDYLTIVREAVLGVLENFDFAAADALLRDGYVFDLVFQHELQHQETLFYLLHLLAISDLKSQIADCGVAENFLKSKILDKSQDQTVEVPSGDFLCGAEQQQQQQRGGAFVYDNESPQFRQFVKAFRLARNLTTNGEFARFIAESGYERSEFWSADGWRWKKAENADSPFYWRRGAANGDWRIRTLFAESALAEVAGLPVYGVSFYEAEAFARFVKKRLPTEFELEKAFLVKPDLIGNLWQWTTSDFAPYPNFKAFPYPEYSEIWFDGDHKVLRGASFVTATEIRRRTFRNFFRRNFRIAFAGIRLASDV